MAGTAPVSVAAFFSALDHPLTPALCALCRSILAASPAISEGIKWNAPSYFIGRDQFFATANIHARGKAGETVLLVLHRGARARSGRVSLQDPAGLVEWLSPDRAAVRFTSLADVRRRTPALQAILKQWITQL